jgi:hypothetical protein
MATTTSTPPSTADAAASAPATVPAGYPTDAGTAAERLVVARAHGALWRWAGAAALTVAGVGHLLSSTAHLGDGSLVLGFFLLTAFGQFGAAVWLAAGPLHRGAPDRRLLLLGIAGVVALVGLYLVAHLTGWLGTLAGSTATPAAGHLHTAPGDPFAAGHAIPTTGPVALAGTTTAAPPQPVTLLGTVTVAAEVLAIGTVAALLPTRLRRRTVNGLLGLAALVWGLWLTGVLG